MTRRLLATFLLLSTLSGVASAAGGGAKRGWNPFRWASSSSHDNPFEKHTLLGSIASGDEKVVAFDRDRGARSPADGSSRYVVIRDAVGGKQHILGILTPQSGRQATSIYDLAALSAPEVGAVFRGVLEADHAATGRSMPGWRARVNLPARVSVDTLHVHGDAGGSSQPALSGPSTSKGDFALHEGKTIGATARVATSTLGAAHEELLGRMILEVARAGKARGIMSGSIEVSTNDSQLTVRLLTRGAFSFGWNE